MQWRIINSEFRPGRLKSHSTDGIISTPIPVFSAFMAAMEPTNPGAVMLTSGNWGVPSSEFGIVDDRAGAELKNIGRRKHEVAAEKVGTIFRQIAEDGEGIAADGNAKMFALDLPQRLGMRSAGQPAPAYGRPAREGACLFPLETPPNPASYK